jgi:hypothetical protein
MMSFASALAILMPSDSAQKRSSNSSQPREDHITEQRSTAGSEESVDATALLALDVLSPDVAIPSSTSAAAATSTAIPSLVVFVVVAFVVVFAAAVDR